MIRWDPKLFMTTPSLPQSESDGFDLGAKLEQLRLFLGYPNDKLFANALGWEQNQYSRVKRGQNPSFETVRSGLKRIGIELNFLSSQETHPSDYVIDKRALSRRMEVNRDLNELEARGERIEELEAALGIAIATVNDLRTVLARKKH